MSSPAFLDQVKTVRTNLSNMVTLNYELYPRGQNSVLNAFLLFSATDDNDPGVDVFLNIMYGAFSAIGAGYGAAGAFGATFVSGMISSWTSSPPPNLDGQFASYLERFNATSNALTNQLDALRDDLGSGDAKTVEKAWNTQFTFNGQTIKVSDLAGFEFPASGTQFDQMVQRIAAEIDTGLWRQMLGANYHAPLYQDNMDTGYKDQNVPPIPWVLQQLDYYKNAYFVWYWYTDPNNNGNCARWMAQMYVITTGQNANTGLDLNEACCWYVFKDKTPGVVNNPAGLFTREQVAEICGIVYQPHVSGVSESYLKAAKRGRTLEQLVEREGREALENRVIEKAREDAVFAQKLALRPKATVEEFFGIKIPDHIRLTVVVEDETHYGLVIRGAKRLEES